MIEPGECQLEIAVGPHSAGSRVKMGKTIPYSALKTMSKDTSRFERIHQLRGAL